MFGPYTNKNMCQFYCQTMLVIDTIGFLDSRHRCDTPMWHRGHNREPHTYSRFQWCVSVQTKSLGLATCDERVFSICLFLLASTVLHCYTFSLFMHTACLCLLPLLTLHMKQFTSPNQWNASCVSTMESHEKFRLPNRRHLFPT